MANLSPFNFGEFQFWCQKILPLVYDESFSYLQTLYTLISYIMKMSSSLEDFKKALDEFGIRVDNVEQQFIALRDSINEEITQIYELLEKIKNGEYVDLYLPSIIAWINKNLKELVKDIVTYVSFGISDDGYFVAYIPDTWDFLTFDTIPWGEPLEGHLVLEW